MDNRVLESELRQACAELVRRVHDGQQRATEELLHSYPQFISHVDCALELVYTEFVTREEMGQRPELSELYERFPQWRERIGRLLDVHDAMDGDETPLVSTSSDSLSPGPVDDRAGEFEIQPGRQLGDFRIEERIGAGGMGVVYQARDTKLDRSVALKVLPSVFSADAERVGRFEREAKLLAALNHPHIATLHGFEQHEGVRFCILEFVPGKDLSESLDSPLPLEETISLFGQIADALETAHEQGIIHRDLKPANIKVTPEGNVKVLDFGLATSFQLSTAESHLRTASDVSELRTKAGGILGTAPYMSPEQARGKPVDKRTDIWAFACCLYEALTGQRAFAGDTASDTIAAVLEREPDWSALPETTPARLALLLRRCLQKDVSRRLRDIGDARIELEEALASPSSELPLAGPVQTQRTVLSGPLRRILPWGVAVLMTIITAIVLRNIQTPAKPRVTRFAIRLADSETLGLASSAPLAVGRPALALAPDGRSLVFVVERDGITRLYLRRFENFAASPIPGTEGAYGPFFSPDSQSVGFFAEDGLKIVSILGGLPELLCDAPNAYGGTWGPDGTIYFSPHFGKLLRRIAASEGTGPQDVASSNGDSELTGLSWPGILPSGQALLLTAGARRTTYAVEVLLLQTGERRMLIPGGTNARYVPTGHLGHLVYARAGTLHAAPFDAEQLTVGPSVPVLPGVRTETFGAAQFAVSNEGTLAYAPGGAMDEGTLVWKDREPDTKPIEAWPGMRAFGSFQLSPEGQRLAIQTPGAKDYISIFDFRRPSVGTPLTRQGEPTATNPIWSPDGQWVVFASFHNGTYSLSRRRADGTGEIEQLLSKSYGVRPASWSPDGQILSYIENHPVRSLDIYLLRLDKDRESEEFLVTPATEYDGEFSPDGRWIAYTSNETGQAEVYVRARSGDGRTHPISRNGGEEPIWSPNSNELFYRTDDKWMVVSVTTQPTFKAGEPTELFRGTSYLPIPGPSYDYDATGDRFLLVQGQESTERTEIRVVLNWFQELERMVPGPGD